MLGTHPAGVLNFCSDASCGSFGCPLCGAREHRHPSRAGITSEKSAAQGPRNVGSFSWGGYYGTTYWADPKSKLVCLFMTQQSPNSHGDIEAKFEAMVYSSLK